MPYGWHRVENFENLPIWISGNCFCEVFLVHVLHDISAVFFVIKLVVLVLAYIMSNRALVLKVQKILFQSFLIRLGENFLKFYLPLIRLFFSMEMINNSPSPPVTISNSNW